MPYNTAGQRKTMTDEIGNFWQYGCSDFTPPAESDRHAVTARWRA